MNTLYYGDNLHVLRTHVPDESVDLVYLDPPFNSGRDYNAVFEDGEADGKRASAQVKAFVDTWRWDDAAHAAYEEVTRDTSGELLRVKLAETMKAFRVVLGTGSTLAYLAMMAPRLVELRRVLRATGSLYLHCDPTASHYLKMLLDGIFGRENFRNEIVWGYKTYQGKASTYFPKKHDILLCYGRSARAVEKFTLLYQSNVEDTVNFKRWRGYIQTDGTILAGHAPMQDTRFVAYYNRWVRENGRTPDPNEVIYTQTGEVVSSVWVDIQALDPKDKVERLGYPTQKPRALLERIIKASSNPGDVVLDPFCGCGTALDAAVVLGRKWVGIDVTHLAVNVIKKRLEDVHNLHPGKDYQVVGEPADLAGAEQLAAEDPHQFQTWALGLVGARTEAGPAKKGGDRGIDGVKVFGTSGGTVRCLISVKGGTVSPGMVRDLRGTLEREKAAMGLLVTLRPPTKGMRDEAREAGLYEPEGIDALFGDPIPRIQVLSVEELLAGKKPVFPLGVSTTDQTIKKGKRQGVK